MKSSITQIVDHVIGVSTPVSPHISITMTS